MYLQFHSVKEPGKNHDIWVWVLFGSLRGRVRFRFCLVLGKTWVLVLFFQAGFGFFPSLVSGNNLQRISW